MFLYIIILNWLISRLIDEALYNSSMFLEKRLVWSSEHVSSWKTINLVVITIPIVPNENFSLITTSLNTRLNLKNIRQIFTTCLFTFYMVLEKINIIVIMCMLFLQFSHTLYNPDLNKTSRFQYFRCRSSKISLN